MTTLIENAVTATRIALSRPAEQMGRLSNLMAG